jgi:hypothetical protein
MSGYVCIAMLEDPPYSIYLAATEEEPEDWCAGLPLQSHLLYWEKTESAEKVVKSLIKALNKSGINGTPSGYYFARPAVILRHFIPVRNLLARDEHHENISDCGDFQGEYDRLYLTDDPCEDLELSRIEALWTAAYESEDQNSSIAFRDTWQNYLHARLKYIFSDSTSVSVYRSASYKKMLGSQVAEYLGILFRRSWLIQSDYKFVNEFLLAGDQIIYDGFLETVQSNQFPEEVRHKACSL